MRMDYISVDEQQLTILAGLCQHESASVNKMQFIVARKPQLLSFLGGVGLFLCCDNVFAQHNKLLSVQLCCNWFIHHLMVFSGRFRGGARGHRPQLKTVCYAFLKNTVSFNKEHFSKSIQYVALLKATWKKSLIHDCIVRFIQRKIVKKIASKSNVFVFYKIYEIEWLK